MTLYLGANYSTGGAPFEGYTPRTQGGEDINKMFIGSDMNVQGIIHEFGHQLDRRYSSTLFESTASYMSKNNLGLLNPAYIDYRASNEQDPNKQPPEYFADYFMTAVLNGKNIKDIDATCEVGDKNCPEKTIQFLSSTLYSASEVEKTFNDYIGGVIISN